MNDETIGAAPKVPPKLARITVHKDIASNLKIGGKHSLKINGEVKSITKAYDHADHYDVEVEAPHVEHIDENGDDENLATMPKENLKKKITKDE